jgi:hypothetical protein
MIPYRLKMHDRFIGQVMRMAIRNRYHLHFNLPMLLWKQRVREQVKINDIKIISMQSFTIIREIEKSIGENQTTVNINDVSRNIFDELQFEFVSLAQRTFGLDTWRASHSNSIIKNYRILKSLS